MRLAASKWQNWRGKPEKTAVRMHYATTIYFDTLNSSSGHIIVPQAPQTADFVPIPYYRYDGAERKWKEAKTSTENSITSPKLAEKPLKVDYAFAGYATGFLVLQMEK